MPGEVWNQGYVDASYIIFCMLSLLDTPSEPTPSGSRSPSTPPPHNSAASLPDGMLLVGDTLNNILLLVE